MTNDPSSGKIGEVERRRLAAKEEEEKKKLADKEEKQALADEEERKELDTLAYIAIVYLIFAGLISILAGAYCLKSPCLPSSIPAEIAIYVAPMLIGFSGSAVGGLTSCLERHAIGYELERGTSYPKEAKEGKFARRFAHGYFARPFLGALIVIPFIWGISQFTDSPDKFTDSLETLGFTAFMAGLLAKSVVELIKNLFKNVFRS